MTSYSALAHAKVNLHLGVGSARADGYHELLTVFQSVSVADKVTLHIGQPRELRLVTPNRAVPKDARNLAWQAVDMQIEDFQARLGLLELPEVAINIDKRIPVAGGMAGGSANAAAALVAAEAWLAGAYGVEPRQDLTHLGARLGADVPFTLLGGTALGTNRGDELTPMISRGPFHWAMITNATGLSTASVFQKLDTMEHTPHLNSIAVAQALLSGDAQQLGQVLHNDLQSAALSLRPDLRAIYSAGMDAGAIAGIISGSGPTWAFLCHSLEAAQRVVDEVSASIAAASGMAVSSPAGGAQLL